MITSTMRALTFHGPAMDTSRTDVAVVARPSPGPGEVLIRVTHAGINFKDVMMRRGDAAYSAVWPVIPGLEVAGVIERLGEVVDDLEVGMRVVALTNTGGLAEYVVASAALTTGIPDGVPAEVAAVVPGVWATAWLLVHEAARVRKGDTVLVHSASGAVGTAIAALSSTAPRLVQSAMKTVLHQVAKGTLTPELTVTEGLDQAAALQQQLADGTAKTKHVIRITPVTQITKRPSAIAAPAPESRTTTGHTEPTVRA